MQVKDLKPRTGNVDITLTIIEKAPIREFDKFGKKGRVCNFVANDDTGKINLTLWNDDVDKVTEDDVIELKNGWVGEYQGELQLSTGKFGQISVVKKAEPKKKSESKKKEDEDDSPPAMDEEDVVDE